MKKFRLRSKKVDWIYPRRERPTSIYVESGALFIGTRGIGAQYNWCAPFMDMKNWNEWSGKLKWIEIGRLVEQSRMQSRGFSRLAITLRNQPLWKVLGDARISEGKRPLHLNRLASGLHFCLFERWEGKTFGSKQRSKVHRSQGRSGWSPGQW